MRIFSITSGGVAESFELPLSAPHGGFLWIGCTRVEFQNRLSEIQATLLTLCGIQLVDLHVSDLLNPQLPSRFDFISQYDLLVFRRLAAQPSATAGHEEPPITPVSTRRGGPPILKHIGTRPVGFAVFENVLLSIHPDDCAARDAFASRLQGSAHDLRTANSRLPTSPADLMLRIVNLMVDGFLELRRELSRQLDHWQSELLNPRARFSNWSTLLDARLSLHQLDEICEDQRQAILDWIESMESWPKAGSPLAQRDHDLLQVRSRDVLEHIERVVHHVRRLEHNIETVVQMHFSAQGNRTNDIMRTLTVLTAIFLPLNLLAGIFGMNFEFLPLAHDAAGFWWALAAMGLIAAALALTFWRKRYLERSAR